jgi:uncharacterized protein
MDDGILPDTSDELTAPFWRAALDGRLTVQRCDTCGYLRWPPAELCPECLGAATTWTALSGVGTVYSYAVYRRAMHPAFATEVPYTVATIALAEGVQMVGRVITESGDADADGSPRIGDTVVVEFERVAPEVALPRWRPAMPAHAADTARAEPRAERFE